MVRVYLPGANLGVAVELPTSWVDWIQKRMWDRTVVLYVVPNTFICSNALSSMQVARFGTPDILVLEVGLATGALPSDTRNVKCI